MSENAKTSSGRKLGVCGKSLPHAFAGLRIETIGPGTGVLRSYPKLMPPRPDRIDIALCTDPSPSIFGLYV